MRTPFITLFFLCISSVAVSSQSPYAPETSNDIKALNASEVSSLLQGQGMGFAKAAELNQHPGPRHVLDLAKRLDLSKQQTAETQHVFQQMHQSAVKFGTQLIEYEKQLDTLFSSGQASSKSLDQILMKIGQTRAKLRGTHLHAHLKMKDILSHHQIKLYDKLRGYSSNNTGHKHDHKHTH